jgi:hypothetical protein
VRNALIEIRKYRDEGWIHRKDWEWAMGIIAMHKFGKLNRNNIALGIGAGTEPVPFYLANKISHVYATDLYGETDIWERAAPSRFLEKPHEFSPFPYKKSTLTVLTMYEDFKSTYLVARL